MKGKKKTRSLSWYCRLCYRWVALVTHSLSVPLRFVKERRPSISPNFNFLGQLQHFQGTLSQKASSSDLHIQQPDSRLPSINDTVNHTQSSQKMNDQAVSSDSADVMQTHTENFYHTEKTQQRYSHSDGSENQQPALSGKRRTLHLSLNQNQQQVQTPCEHPAPNPCASVKPAKPTQLQVPSGSASLLEKRKSLTLSLTPLGISPPSPSSSSSRQQAAAKTVHNCETAERPETQRDTGSCRQTGADTRREQQNPSHSKCSRAQVKEQGPLSPFSFTLNKLLDWGERLLLGGVFVHPVRMGQPALPYRCWEHWWVQVGGSSWCLNLCMLVRGNQTQRRDEGTFIPVFISLFINLLQSWILEPHSTQRAVFITC